MNRMTSIKPMHEEEDPTFDPEPVRRADLQKKSVATLQNEPLYAIALSFTLQLRSLRQLSLSFALNFRSPLASPALSLTLQLAALWRHCFSFCHFHPVLSGAIALASHSISQPLWRHCSSALTLNSQPAPRLSIARPPWEMAFGVCTQLDKLKAKMAKAAQKATDALSKSKLPTWQARKFKEDMVVVEQRLSDMAHLISTTHIGSSCPMLEESYLFQSAPLPLTREKLTEFARQVCELLHIMQGVSAYVTEFDVSTPELSAVLSI
ncbi:hypothetical protein CYMTET_36229 [Cymbomonas tetramitiformis]|uniref:Uncharacterized protein n=1 Tax=Cymbomonas tetramitiformis TaxID=36881 RepID=A0AAE0F7E7_9CHLO|nr:hypothetical protein CYMTET_36229 [Cymbomonas tetramitiformis]